MHCFIFLGVQSVPLQHFTCSRYSFARDSCCHWPCISSCFSFSASFINLFEFSLSKESTPTFLVCTGLSQAFSTACHDLCLRFHYCIPLPLRQGCLSFCHQMFVVTLLTQVGRVGLLTLLYHYRNKLPETEGFVTATVLSPQNMGFAGC